MKILNVVDILIILAIIIPQIVQVVPIETNEQWEYSMRIDFNRTIDLFEFFNATAGFKLRQSIYLNGSKVSNGLDAQASRVYLNLSVNEETILNSLNKLYDLKSGSDFQMNSLIRILYLDLNKSVLSPQLRDNISDAFGKTFYWYDELYNETGDNSEIIWTENHQILYHTAELLAGQLFPNDTFTLGMTGNEHIAHATPLIKKWLDFRGQLGFTEWHSNTYFSHDINALVNLVDFAMDSEIVYKAAMVLDQMAFGFVNNYFKGRYATSHGRAYDSTVVGESASSKASRDSPSEAVWVMLGIGEHNPSDTNNRAAIALSTSDYYAPPPILEAIANNTRLNYEHKERNSIYIEEGPKYNLSYSEDDLMVWWGLSAPMAPQIIESSMNFMDKYNVDPMTIAGPRILMDFFKVASFLKGKSLGDYSETLEMITRGVCLEAANIYTYRTPYYQLAGAQDHMKGMDGMQEHIWQASLDDDAFIYTNSPGGITKDFNQEFVGGWKPRATLYKNIGVIQYDRGVMPLEGELIIFFLNLISDMKFYNHAYFPRWAFDDVQSHDKWTFGAKNDSYVALYSHEPTWWASDYELRVKGYKNLWMVELGSVVEYGTFEQFISTVRQANLEIIPQKMGYIVQYTSPSRGLVTVAWDGPMYVNGTNIDLGPYPRFDNPYCYQEFGTRNTTIQFGSQRLMLDFNTTTRLYEII